MTAELAAGASVQRFNDLIVSISAELAREFRGIVPAWVITAVAADAVRDLRGSIAVEALPEMAIRLSRVRLTQRLPARVLVGAGPKAR